MVETVKREYAEKHPSISTEINEGPKKGKKGATRWANPAKTRGNKTKKFEQGINAATKLTSLKRR